MRTTLGHANSSEYFLWLPPEDWLRNEVGTLYQERTYFICDDANDVLTPDDSRAMQYSDRSVIVANVPLGDAEPSTGFARWETRLYAARKFVAPADWFPGICDAWVKAHATNAEIIC